MATIKIKSLNNKSIDLYRNNLTLQSGSGIVLKVEKTGAIPQDKSHGSFTTYSKEAPFEAILKQEIGKLKNK